MANIKAKKAPVIKKGNGYVYSPSTFDQFIVPYFHEVSSAAELLIAIDPMIIDDRKFIWFDTETHPYYKNSQLVPKTVVRRWVGTGKKATPQDFPFSMAICDGKNAYVLFDTIGNGFKEMRKLAPLFEDPTIEKCAHNAKYDMHMTANAGMKIVGRIHDTAVAAKITDENRFSFKLVDLAKHAKGSTVVFEYMVDTYKQLNKIVDYRDIPRPLMTQYTCADTWNDCVVFQNEWERLKAENLMPLYDRECEYLMVAYAMERYGMPVDTTYEEPLRKELTDITEESEQAIYDEAGGMLNINSTAQLYNLFLKLGVDPSWIGKTDKGNPKLDKVAMANLAEVHGVSIVKKILEFKKNDKLLNTYCNGIYGQRDANNRVHGSINQTEARTGRQSINKPALQTLPKKDKRIRTAFTPDEEHKLWFLDLDQVEYRLFAHYAKATGLIEAIKNGYDVHGATAAIIFNVPIQEMLDGLAREDPKYVEMRAKGKTVNFAMVYGVGIDHLCEMLHITKSEAYELKATYFAGIPEARPFIQTVEYVIKTRGFVKNFYGRRRRLDSDDCYKAPNSLIQGCAADYLKDKMVNMFKYIAYHALCMKMINVVHDETITDVPKEEEQFMPELRWIQSDFDTFRCPITAGAEYAEHDWGHKVACEEIGFREPADKGYLDYDIYNGKVFDIYREVS